MKKKARSVLTVALIICMGLVMTSGTASATITISDPPTQVAVGQKLPPETKIISNATNGLEITYNVPAGTRGAQDAGGTDTTEAFQNTPTQLIPAVLKLDSNGYRITSWEVTSIDTSGDKDLLTLTASEKIPIQYTLEYYDSDQTTLLHKDTNVTVENAQQFVSPSPTKDGYVFSHWVPVTSGGTIPGGIAMKPFFLASQGHPDHGFVIKLYAAWTPLDHSPAAGDDMPVGMLAFLVIASIASAAGVAARSKRDAM